MPAADDRGVGDVEHREHAAVGAEDRQEVDDAAAEEARVAEDAVDQVAERPAEHEARA